MLLKQSVWLCRACFFLCCPSINTFKNPLFMQLMPREHLCYTKLATAEHCSFYTIRENVFLIALYNFQFYASPSLVIYQSYYLISVVSHYHHRVITHCNKLWSFPFFFFFFFISLFASHAYVPATPSSVCKILFHLKPLVAPRVLCPTYMHLVMCTLC